MVLPIFVCLCFRDYHDIMPFVYSIGLTLLAAVVLGIKKPKNDVVFARESFISVSLGWLLLSLFGALPFYISGSIPNIIDCIFETVSGFTTTGATILNTVETLPKSILFWRAFTHWIGGMGVLVFLLMLTQISEGNAMYIMRAEVPGPSVGKLAPRMRSNSLILYGIYTALTVLEAVILTIEGQSVFDAVTNAMSTAGTGGFSVRDMGIAAYGSPAVEWTIAVFMLLFGINFNLYYLILFGRIKQVFASEELKVYTGIIAAATLTVGINVMNYYGSFGDSIRKAFFQVTSVISTTGFSNVEFMNWPQLSRAVILVLLFTGACAGSTGGGFKISRLIIMVKEIGKELLVLVHPEAVKHIRLENKSLEHSVVRSVNCYLIMYVVIFMVSVFLIACADNFDFTTNFSAVAATFNNIGPGLAAVGPTCNFSAYSDFSKIILTFDMLAGRLEILPMMLLFLPRTWRKSN